MSKEVQSDIINLSCCQQVHATAHCKEYIWSFTSYEQRTLLKSLLLGKKIASLYVCFSR